MAIILHVWGTKKRHDIHFDGDGVVLNPEDIEPAIQDYAKLQGETPDLLTALLLLMKREAQQTKNPADSVTIKELVYASPDAKLSVTRSDREHANKYELDTRIVDADADGVATVHYSLSRPDTKRKLK